MNSETAKRPQASKASNLQKDEIVYLVPNERVDSDFHLNEKMSLQAYRVDSFDAEYNRIQLSDLVYSNKGPVWYPMEGNYEFYKSRSDAVDRFKEVYPTRPEVSQYFRQIMLQGDQINKDCPQVETENGPITRALSHDLFSTYEGIKFVGTHPYYDISKKAPFSHVIAYYDNGVDQQQLLGYIRMDRNGESIVRISEYPIEREDGVVPSAAEKITSFRKELKSSISSFFTSVVDKGSGSGIDREEGETVKEYTKRLAKEGVVQHTDVWKDKYILLDKSGGRLSIILDVNGESIPFYQSSAGTDGKKKNKWYPYFGNYGNWLIKGSIDEMENSYGIEAIRKIQTFLNKNLSEKDALGEIASLGLRSGPRTLLAQQTEKKLGEIYPRDYSIVKNSTNARDTMARIMGTTILEGKSTDAEKFEAHARPILDRLKAKENKIVSVLDQEQTQEATSPTLSV